MKNTYRNSGVNIDAAEEFVAGVKSLGKRTAVKGMLKGIGGFGGFFEMPKGYKSPVLVSSADGVGTKLKIAVLCNRHSTVGVDLVGMNVNDIITTGAKPLFFLDYIGVGRLDKRVLLEVVKGVVAGCKEAGCALIGGETAEMPGMYTKGDYDLAGFCVGVVEKKKIIDNSRINSGDVVIGLSSSGLHSNGFSLVRKVFSNRELKQHAEELLTPTRIYVKPILSLQIEHRKPKTENRKPKTEIKGIAHITGGGFYDKITRILPVGKVVRIKKGSWRIPEIFLRIQKKGRVDEKEMFHTFNMGIGMTVIVDRDSAEKALKILSKDKQKVWIIGEVVKGKRGVSIL